MIESNPIARAINGVTYQWEIQNLLRLAELQGDPAMKERILHKVATLLNAN